MDSRLDRMIARLTTQRRALERAAEETRGLPGPVLEIGLGKGRTYSHLRKLFPDRRIIAFDRDLHAPADAAPAGADLVLGDFRETLSALSGCAPAALAHADFGSEDRARDTAQAGWLAALIDALMAPGGLVVSDRAMQSPRWTPLPFDTPDWPYFLWRVN
ncbi:class I SAM-dependent methyltransferase [Mesorhizobium sp. WSM4887]|uniref:class I SAM-dependent methyltransferase n=1 Tax=Mesorhizobium sp. WSM4887 TaxID=3038543 RepID=UPI0024178CEE|nr:class I SAM-dependent methyltransferase [Mesorhizobium sp. WSM4887]MDG4891815.1 class I SAM-dependent methyltransferase [Mesorhizobium sp. WSM4887]